MIIIIVLALVDKNDYNIAEKKYLENHYRKKMSVNYDQEIDALVRTGVYRDRDEVIQDALNTFLALKSNLRLEIAIQLFKSDEVSLLRASEIAGINFFIFKNILIDRVIKIPVEVESTETMDKQIEKFEKLLIP